MYWCVCRLQDKGVGKDAEWGSLLEKPPLKHADDTDSATLSHAVDIFVERHHLLWKVGSDPCVSQCMLVYSASFIRKTTRDRHNPSPRLPPQPPPSPDPRPFLTSSQTEMPGKPSCMHAHDAQSPYRKAVQAVPKEQSKQNCIVAPLESPYHTCQ